MDFKLIPYFILYGRDKTQINAPPSKITLLSDTVMILNK